MSTIIPGATTSYAAMPTYGASYGTAMPSYGTASYGSYMPTTGYSAPMSYGGYSGYGAPAMDEDVVQTQLKDAQKVPYVID